VLNGKLAEEKSLGLVNSKANRIAAILLPHRWFLHV